MSQQIEPGEQLIQRILRQTEARLREALTSDAGTLEEIEQESQRIGERVTEIVERERLQSKGSGHSGPRAPCPHCGGIGRYRGEYVRHVVTRSGDRRLSRAYYYCAACRQGFCPLDALLGPLAGAFSVGVWALATRFASYLPFAAATRELAEVCGVRLSVSSLRRISAASGAQIEREWAVQEAAMWKDPEAIRSTGAVGPWQVSMDGVMIFVGREWREAKLGVVYHQRRPGSHETGSHETGPIRANYYATLAKSDVFGRRVRVLSQLSGADRCARGAVVSDGGAWIWQEVGKYFADKVQILDYYHACEHLWEIARARYGDRSAPQKRKAAAWVKGQQEHLLAGRVEAVIRAVASWAPAKAEHQQTQRREVAYLRTHRARMRYDQFQAAGWHIGSGVMEAGCKAVVQARMKGAGMRWGERGAQSMLHLRAAVCSDPRVDFQSLARTTMAVA